MDGRDPTNIALELYARGYFHTRDEALTCAKEDPDALRQLVALGYTDREMRHTGDTASITEWGHAGLDDKTP